MLVRGGGRRSAGGRAARDGDDEAATGHLADPAAACTGRGCCLVGLRRGRRAGVTGSATAWAWAWAWAGWPLLLAYINACFKAAESGHRAVSLATASLRAEEGIVVI